jgi:hypothetical protein
MTDKKAGQVSLSTVATFCAHTTEMLEHVADRDELIKRHRDSLERLRDGLAHAADGHAGCMHR